jgi:putative transport protein
MGEWQMTFLQSNPSLLIFAALAGGYALGRVKLGAFSLGSTASVLLISISLGALVLGNTEYDLGLIKTISFGFFIFAIGYRVGPDFVSGIRRGGAKYVAIALFFCIAALVSAVALARVFGLGGGYAGGMLGGALTQSSVIGTADGAIAQLSGQQITSAMNLKSDVAVAYAVTYIFGTAGLIVFLKLLPAIWRINLPAEARKEEEQLGSLQKEDTVEAFHWSNLVMPRAYRLERDDADGRTVDEIRSKFPGYVSVEALRRGEEVTRPVPGDFSLKKGDVIILTGYRRRVYLAEDIIGPEADDSFIREMLGEILSICITEKSLDGKTFSEIFSVRGHGCFVQAVYRQGHQLPLGPDLKLFAGDLVRVVGYRPDVEKLAEELGYAERETNVTDLVTVGTGLILGTLVGLLGITVAGIPITLGVGGGVLVSGIFFGWLRSRRPTWGYIPVSTQWIFSSLGLNMFIACVGIAAGPRAVSALQQAGVSILIAGACLTMLPHLMTWMFGLYALKLNPVLLLGAMTGSGTCTAALNTVKEDCGSSIPVIGYTVPYAIGNVLLTVWGALVVNLV